jgi:SsrA-binding protein
VEKSSLWPEWEHEPFKESRHALHRSASTARATVNLKAKNKEADGEKLIAKSRRARFDYEIEEQYEGGLVLVGSEVKSMRDGKVDIVDAYASVEQNEVWLKQLYVAPLEHATAFPHEPRRARKVLLHRREIAALDKAIARGGYTVIPLRLYFKKGIVKVELGLARGKKTVDKRAVIAKKTADREAKAEITRARKGGR